MTALQRLDGWEKNPKLDEDCNPVTSSAIASARRIIERSGEPKRICAMLDGGIQIDYSGWQIKVDVLGGVVENFSVIWRGGNKYELDAN